MSPPSLLLETLRQRFPQRVLGGQTYRGQETVLVSREGLIEIATCLGQDPGMAFDFLLDLSCVDYLTFGRSQRSAPAFATPSPLPYYMEPKPSEETWTRGVLNESYRFDVVYHLFASGRSRRIRLRVPVASADPVVPSVTGLWAAANWYEREVWDMFGIRFTGHPNLRRILMYEEFQGHALRKDYPIRKRQPLIGPKN